MPERTTWKSFFAEEVATPFQNAFIKLPANDLRRSNLTKRSPFLTLFMQSFANLYCDGEKSDIKDICMGQNENRKKAELLKMVSPLKLLNPFKLLVLISRSIEIGILAIGSPFNTDAKGDSKLRTAGRAIKRLFLLPFSGLTALLNPFAQIDRAPLKETFAPLLKKILPKRKKKSAPLLGEELSADDEETVKVPPEPRNATFDSGISAHESAPEDDSEENTHDLDDEQRPLLPHEAARPRADSNHSSKSSPSFFSRFKSFFSSEKPHEARPTHSSATLFQRPQKKPSNNPIYVGSPEYDGDNYEEAKAKKDALLINPIPAANVPAAIASQALPLQSPAPQANVTRIKVIPVDIVKHQRSLIKTVTIQIQNPAKNSAKSEFYFQKGDIKNMKGMAAMEWAAKNIEEFRKIMPDKNQPIRIIKGNMTSDCVEALIIYCKYKKLEYIPPREFKKAISDSQVERFKKKWELIDHKDDRPHRFSPAI